MSKGQVADICYLVEGCYPFVRGGVSSWLDWLIRQQPEKAISIVAIVADDGTREAMYDLPSNVVSFDTISLLAEPQLSNRRRIQCDMGSLGASLAKFWSTGDTAAFSTLCDVAQNATERRWPLSVGKIQGISSSDLLSSPQAWSVLCQSYERVAPESSFSDFVWAWRSLVGGLFSVLMSPVPSARIYHAVSTGYAGILGARLRLDGSAKFVITEHGIYTNERRIDLITADWLTDRIHDGFSICDVRKDVRDVWINMFESFARVAYSLADKTTTLYSDNQQFQISLGANPKNLLVIPNGVDLSRFADIERSETKPNFVVGLIGRVVPIKDVLGYIRACAEVKVNIDGVQFLVAGPYDEDPSYFADCQALVHELGLDDSFSFLGHSDMRSVLSTVDVVVLTSISEAQPLVVLEAGAAGVPVVATDVGSCREIIEGQVGEDPHFGVGGAIVPPMDTHSMASAMINLLSDSQFRFVCGENLKHRVSSLYTSEVAHRAYEALYQEVAG